MKIINLKDYDESMGMLIDVRHPLDYKKEHDPRSVNIYADKLIMNHSKYLTKDKTYYITCSKGMLSKRVVRTLLYYGYHVVQVI